LTTPLIGGIFTYMPMSGKEMLKAYEQAGWKVLRQKGSHVQVGKDNLRETIPMHKELAKGLERKLIKRIRGD
jgi:predicted RNA binding protein YcfA (HicA-like mRNA interferase family)